MEALRRNAGRVIGGSIAIIILSAASLPLGAAEPPKRSSDPINAQASLAAMHLADGYEIELVASEPQVMSPVAIDWGPDGRLWVVEMADYPYGIDGHGKPGGRVKVLEDTHHDGHFDKATTFLDGVNMPNGISVWRDGALVTAAPDILLARDTTGAGKATDVRPLFTGFKLGNPQLRVNGLRWGLDGWLYCANGWSGGNPRPINSNKSVKLDGHDLRIQPDQGLLDIQSGQSEFGRDRDDWGNWFGCDNSHPLFYFALDDDYTRRNAHVPYPDPRLQVILPANPQVFPASRPQKRYYNDQLGYVTSACSSTIYRDQMLFPGESNQHVFVCEPAYNLVHHEVMHEEGVGFRAGRPKGEEKREFIASEDQWFRPVMVRTGPDGALWVVDMYRYMIEHPDWLPPQGKEELKPFYRDGEDRGRIYRIFPKGRRPGPLPGIDKLSTEDLVKAMDTSNGTLRDMVQKQLVWRNDREAIEPLRKLAAGARDAAVRLQAVYTLDLLGGLTSEMIATSLHDPQPQIRRAAIQLAEPRAGEAPALVDAAIKLTGDPDAKVRVQLACTLGTWGSAQAGKALGNLASTAGDDPYLCAAVMSSAGKHFASIVNAVSHCDHPLAEPLFGQMIIMAAATDNRPALAALVAPALDSSAEGFTSLQYAAIERLLDTLASRELTIARAARDHDELGNQLAKLGQTFESAREVLKDDDKPVELRSAAAGLLGREPAEVAADLDRLSAHLTPQTPPDLQTAVVRAIAHTGDSRVPQILINNWASHSPQVRSAVIDRLTARSAWAIQLLEAIRSGAVSRNDLDAAHRQRLLEHAVNDVKSLAREVLGSPPDASRDQVVQKYQDALNLSSDAQRGQKLFLQNCAVCHHKGPIGNDIGPNLDSVIGWRGDALLVAILDPSRQVEPQYLAYTITLNDGDGVYGIITSESGSSVTLKGLDGKPRTLLRSQVKSLTCTNRSLMPDGFESALDKQAIADVIRFLQSTPGS